MKNELVKTTTEDGLFLNGLFVEGAKDKPALILIHGFEGDFYSHRFIKSIGDLLAENNMTFLSVQTRGLGLENEFITTDFEGRYVGAHMEILEEAYLDIDGWVKFLVDRGYTNIILSGHSLGTLKIVRYLSEGKLKEHINKLILLCPFDKNGSENIVTEGKWKDYVKEAKVKVGEGKGREIIPEHWEEVVMSYQTFYSWYNEDDFGKMFDFYQKDYDFPVLNSIEIPVHTIVGTKDEFFHRTNPENPGEAIDILLKNLKHGTGKLVEGAKHNFKGFEDIVSNSVLEFISHS